MQRHPYEFPPTPTQDPSAEEKKDFFDGSAPLQTAPSLSKVDVEHGQIGRANDYLVSSDSGLRKTFKARHIQLITLGGSIGTGLFLALGNAIAVGGPLGALLAYAIMGIAYARASASLCLGDIQRRVLNIMTTLCEVLAVFPMPGGLVSMIKRFTDPALSTSAGYASGAVLISYWNQTINPAVWITILMVVVFTVNIIGSRGIGEFESVFATLKVMLIIGLIIAGIVIGTELTSMAAAESVNPRRDMPRAIKLTYMRILVFYVLGTLVAGLCVPSTDPSLNLSSTAAKSPFVIAMVRAGISGLPSVVNAGVLTSALSAGTCYVFISSRTLHGMALGGTAPRFFARTTSWGLPYASLTMSFLLGLLGYMVCGTASAGDAFWYIATLCTSAGMQCWLCINLAYLRYLKGLKAQGIDRSTLPYRAPFQPYLTYVGAGIALFGLLTQSYTIFLPGQWNTATFVTSYISIPLQGIIFLGWKIYHKTSFVRPEDMDFNTGKSPESEPLPPPRNIWERLYRLLF